MRTGLAPPPLSSGGWGLPDATLVKHASRRGVEARHGSPSLRGERQLCAAAETNLRAASQP